MGDLHANQRRGREPAGERFEVDRVGAGGEVGGHTAGQPGGYAVDAPTRAARHGVGRRKRDRQRSHRDHGEQRGAAGGGAGEVGDRAGVGGAVVAVSGGEGEVGGGGSGDRDAVALPAVEERGGAECGGTEGDGRAFLDRAVKRFGGEGRCDRCAGLPQGGETERVSEVRRLIEIHVLGPGVPETAADPVGREGDAGRGERLRGAGEGGDLVGVGSAGVGGPGGGAVGRVEKRNEPVLRALEGLAAGRGREPPAR